MYINVYTLSIVTKLVFRVIVMRHSRALRQNVLLIPANSDRYIYFDIVLIMAELILVVLTLTGPKNYCAKHKKSVPLKSCSASE
jgi:hypothetical protein